MKIFKIIFINLLVFLALFGVFEVFCYFYVKQDAQSFMNNYNKEAKDKNQSLMTVKYGKIKPISEDKFTNWRKPIWVTKTNPRYCFSAARIFMVGMWTKTKQFPILLQNTQAERP